MANNECFYRYGHEQINWNGNEDVSRPIDGLFWIIESKNQLKYIFLDKKGAKRDKQLNAVQSEKDPVVWIEKNGSQNNERDNSIVRNFAAATAFSLSI